MYFLYGWLHNTFSTDLSTSVPVCTVQQMYTAVHTVLVHIHPRPISTCEECLVHVYGGGALLCST